MWQSNGSQCLVYVAKAKSLLTVEIVTYFYKYVNNTRQKCAPADKRMILSIYTCNKSSVGLICLSFSTVEILALSVPNLIVLNFIQHCKRAFYFYSLLSFQLLRIYWLKVNSTKNKGLLENLG